MPEISVCYLRPCTTGLRIFLLSTNRDPSHYTCPDKRSHLADATFQPHKAKARNILSGGITTTTCALVALVCSSHELRMGSNNTLKRHTEPGSRVSDVVDVTAGSVLFDPPPRRGGFWRQ